MEPLKLHEKLWRRARAPIQLRYQSPLVLDPKSCVGVGHYGRSFRKRLSIPLGLGRNSPLESDGLRSRLPEREPP